MCKIKIGDYVEYIGNNEYPAISTARLMNNKGIVIDIFDSRICVLFDGDKVVSFPYKYNLRILKNNESEIRRIKQIEMNMIIC